MKAAKYGNVNGVFTLISEGSEIDAKDKVCIICKFYKSKLQK